MTRAGIPHNSISAAVIVVHPVHWTKMSADSSSALARYHASSNISQGCSFSFNVASLCVLLWTGLCPLWFL
ncbi:hypothetical protein BDV28DRAFT_83396 [Aspergillus coremiiformis]|uniref:Uncharacterized protein n=1 Tax=Aspergillus coremiiformis TaxID=138285 RepID=A0A5N6ZID1_9EURO|nr:hypothetical protein BDV28DRAFT_83396 [Aspergillus coremiiformis]